MKTSVYKGGLWTAHPTRMPLWTTGSTTAEFTMPIKKTNTNVTTNKKDTTMKKNIRQQLAYWAAALLLTACAESEKLTEEPHDNTQGHNIGFSVDLSQDWYAEQPGTRAVLKQSQPQNLQMTGSGGMTAWLTESTRMGIDAPLDKAEVVTDDGQQTRGTLVTQRSEMEDFSTICFHDGSCHYKNVKSDNAGNLISPHRWWDGWSLRFYALHPYDSSDGNFNTSSSNEVRYTYTGGTTAAATKDLMYASTTELPYTADGIAPLHFNHALTAVSFAFGNNPDFDKTITSIQLQNVYTSGTLVIPKDGGTATWDLTGQEKTGTVTLSLSPGVVANTSAANTSISSEKFFMIPQNLDGVVIKIVFSDNKYLSRTLTSSSN